VVQCEPLLFMYSSPGGESLLARGLGVRRSLATRQDRVRGGGDKDVRWGMSSPRAGGEKLADGTGPDREGVDDEFNGKVVVIGV